MFGRDGLGLEPSLEVYPPVASYQSSTDTEIPLQRLDRDMANYEVSEQSFSQSRTRPLVTAESDINEYSGDRGQRFATPRQHYSQHVNNGTPYDL